MLERTVMENVIMKLVRIYLVPHQYRVNRTIILSSYMEGFHSVRPLIFVRTKAIYVVEMRVVRGENEMEMGVVRLWSFV
jgi:hypothetical protein